MKVAVIVVFSLSALYWVFQLYSLIRSSVSMPRLSRLKDFPDEVLERYPSISVIITACDEADTIEAAVKSRLADDYPNLEFILVDDRSGDGTSEIVDRLAALDSRVKAVHITELPEGWLGKVHALHRGTEAASGDWLLFSDADVHVKPGTLSRLIARCEKKRIDLVAGVPDFRSGGFFVDAAVSVFLRALMAAGRGYLFEDERSNAAGGSGSFNLVRRTAWEKTEGFPWLKMEIIDDVTLGQMLKVSGARISGVLCKGFVEVCWYPTFRGMLNGAGRAAVAAVGNYNIFQLLAISVPGFIVDMAPFYALFPWGIPILPYVAGGVIAVAVAANIVSNRMLGLPLLPGVMLPLGHVLVLFTTLMGGVTFLKTKGINWRGTFYSTKQLKAGRRFRYFLPSSKR